MRFEANTRATVRNGDLPKWADGAGKQVEQDSARECWKLDTTLRVTDSSWLRVCKRVGRSCTILSLGLWPAVTGPLMRPSLDVNGRRGKP
jgi:hypothetical protein